MKDQANDIPQQRTARMAGIFYLAYLILYPIAATIQGKRINWNNATATAGAIATSQEMFRAGVAMELVAALLFLLAAWALYSLLKNVDRDLALLFLVLNATGVAIECVGAMMHYAALTLSTGASWITGMKPDELQALALIFLKVSASSSLVDVLFYGAWVIPLGYLVIQSRFLPKVLGILLICDGVALMICFVQLWLLPGHEKWTYPLYPVMLAAEAGLALWLLIKGVKVREAMPAIAA